MSKLAKRLRALANGKELPWSQIVSLVEAFGGDVLPPRGGGSHFKIVFANYEPITVPVHNGKIKRIYALKIAELLEDIGD